jgi:hypothetical protein
MYMVVKTFEQQKIVRYSERKPVCCYGSLTKPIRTVPFFTHLRPVINTLVLFSYNKGMNSLRPCYLHLTTVLSYHQASWKR